MFFQSQKFLFILFHICLVILIVSFSIIIFHSLFYTSFYSLLPYILLHPLNSTSAILTSLLCKAYFHLQIFALTNHSVESLHLPLRNEYDLLLHFLQVLFKCDLQMSYILLNAHSLLYFSPVAPFTFKDYRVDIVT